MKKRTIFNIVRTIVGLALSLFLAMGGMAIEVRCGIRTPGAIAADIFVRPKMVGDYGAIGTRIDVQILVDWILWFALMSVIYFLVASAVRKIRTGAKSS
jgi:hypothetical protein